MKYLKIAGIALAVLVVLAAAGIALIASQFDAARLKLEAASLVQEKTQRKLKIDGELKLSFWPKLGLSLGRVTLSERNSESEFAAIEGARVSVALMPLMSRRLVVDAVELDGLKATLIKRADGKLNIDDLLKADQPAGGDKPRAPGGEGFKIDLAGLRVTRAELAWRDEGSGAKAAISGLDLATGRILAEGGSYSLSKAALSMKGTSGAESFELKLDMPQLTLAPERSSGEAVTLTAALAGAERSAKLTLTLSGIEGKGKELVVGKLAVELAARQGGVSVEGQLSGALKANLEQRTAGLEQFTGSLALDGPRPIKLPLSGTLSADLARQTAEGRLATQFDESKLALKFGLAKFSPLALNFDLDVDSFNLDKYLPPPAEKSAEQKGPAPADPALDFSFLKGPSVAGRVSVGQLQARNVKLAQLRLQAQLTNGRLELSPLSAKLYDGTLAGSLAIDSRDGSLALRQNLEQVNLGPLLKDAAGMGTLEGRASVAVDLAARGKTLVAMKRALGGTAKLALKDGAFKGINLAQSLRDIKGKLGGKQDVAVAGAAADRTDFTELTASFKIAGGVAHNDDLSAKSPFLRLSGSGDIDIGEGNLNYLLKASVVASAGGQGAGDLAQLKGITVPVRASGPWAHPAWKLELAGLVGEAAKAKVEETRQKAQEQLKDRLKGLLGR